MHEIRAGSQEDYDSLKFIVRSNMDAEEWDAAVAARQKMYEDAGISYAGDMDAMEEELVADAVSYTLGDSTLMERFAAE
ncbi:MAG: hypothetical protein LBH39_04650, partial [Clostridiales Family XIII bacterium]|nr:hypothetical protein [Clostridiales Family XIII bacterium]